MLFVCFVLLQNTQSDRDVFIYYPSNPDPKLGVFAVRWNQYKAHYYSNG